MLVRLAFLLLTLAGGAGLVLYMALWGLTSDEVDEDVAGREPTARQAVALASITLGTLLLLRAAGLWFGDALVWPAAIAAAGSAVLWSRSSNPRSPWRWLEGRVRETPFEDVFAGGVSVPRLLGGLSLITVGMGAFLAANTSLAALRGVLLAILITVLGIGLVFGPWLIRLVQQLGAERRERIRSEERAEMAAHLHDSVLQTLALIQRTADNPRRTVVLARQQERELRAWLYGDDPTRQAGTVRNAVEALVAEVESQHDLTVDTVVVGDAETDERLHAVLRAIREALTNAGKHAGVADVSLYVEVAPDELTAFVRDRGRGFDPAAVPPDRRGIADSLRRRVERHGGRVEIVSAPDQGTEVSITVPLKAAPVAEDVDAKEPS